MSFDKDIVDEINELRSDPKKYADKVSKYISYFQGKELHIPGRKASIQTHEGARAFQEAVNYLSRQNPVEPLLPSKGLFRSAQDFLKKIQRKNANVEEIDVDKMLEKYGTYYGDFIRGTDYGGETVEQSIINLIVSDGDLNRRQRESLLSRDYKLVGAANGTHPIFRHCTVIFQCTEFENTYDADDVGFLDGSSPKSLPKSTKSSIKPKDETVTKYEPSTGSTIITTTKYNPAKRTSEETTVITTSYPYKKTGEEIVTTTTMYDPKTKTTSTKQISSSKYLPTSTFSKETTTTKVRYDPKTGTKTTEVVTSNDPGNGVYNRYQPRIKTKESNTITSDNPAIDSILSKYQPQGRTTEKITTSRYIPNTTSKYQPNLDIAKHTTTTRYNPKTGTNQEITTTSYQPQVIKETNTSRYQVPLNRSTQLGTTSKYEPKHGRQNSEQYQPQTKSYLNNRYQPQTRANPLSRSTTKTSGGDVYCVSENRKEKVSIQGGKKVKEVTIEKVMSDGTRNIETFIS